MNNPEANKIRAENSARRVLLITGSSGFIGSHLCRELERSRHADDLAIGLDIRNPEAPILERFEHRDIRDPQQLSGLPISPHAVVHLAAEAEAIIPFSEFATLLDTNLSGTMHLLQTLQPALFLFASSSAVYGHADRRGVTEAWENAHPVGSYGMSKAAGEIMCRDWALEGGASAVAFRLGNVVGSHCRGLIPYLVRHALNHPGGEVAAMARGQGKIVRDYVPVAFVAKIFAAALAHPWQPRALEAFNLGCGRGLTNREVTDIVSRVLDEHGYRLRVDWSTPVPAAESRAVVLDMTKTSQTFGLAIPSQDEVVATIEDATRFWIEFGAS